MTRSYIALEMGGTNIRFAIITEDKEIVLFQKESTLGLKKAKNKSRYLYEKLRPLIEDTGEKNVIAITMALSSLMDKNCEYIFSSPMVDGFDNIPLKEDFSQFTKLPVILEKDVNAILLYEVEKNRLPDEGIIVCVFLGTGMGNSMVVDGKIYRGYTGSACELGHIPIPYFQESCDCGKKGCIEIKASGKRLYEVANDLGCKIENIFTKHGDEEEVKSIIDHYAYAIASEVSILDPRAVLIGGGVVSIKAFPLATLTKKVRENLRTPYPRENFSFITASQDEIAGVSGAVINAKKLGFL